MHKHGMDHFRVINEERKSEFLAIIEKGIVEAEECSRNEEEKGNKGLAKGCFLAKNNFIAIKQELIKGTLQSSKGNGMGITRGLSEIGVPSSLYDAGREIEQYYKLYWRENA